MAEFAEKAGAGAVLDDLALAHDRDPVRHLRDHTEIMGDQQQAGAILPDQAPQQIEDSRLGGDIKCRGGLVGDQQPRPQGHGRCDHDTLPLSA